MAIAFFSSTRTTRSRKFHPWAVHAAVNANCLGAQNRYAYWDYADYLHAISTQSATKSPDGQNADSISWLL